MIQEGFLGLVVVFPVEDALKWLVQVVALGEAVTAEAEEILLRQVMEALGGSQSVLGAVVDEFVFVIK